MGKRIGRFGLVNYVDHPTDKGFKVFNFNSKQEGILFEQELNSKGIYHEKDEEVHENEIIYLFAVRQRDFEAAARANYMVSAKTRKHLIPNNILRYALVIFFFVILGMAIYGYTLSQ